MNSNNPPAAFVLLKQQFPKVFTQVVPLKIGIHRELFAILHNIPRDYSLKQCRRALCWYTHSEKYLRQIVAGHDRFDMDGNPCGKVTKAEQEYAARKFNKKSVKSTKSSFVKLSLVD